MKMCEEFHKFHRPALSSGIYSCYTSMRISRRSIFMKYSYIHTEPRNFPFEDMVKQGIGTAADDRSAKKLSPVQHRNVLIWAGCLPSRLFSPALRYDSTTLYAFQIPIFQTKLPSKSPRSMLSWGLNSLSSNPGVCKLVDFYLMEEFIKE